MQLSLSLPKQILRSTTAVVYADQALVSGLNFLSAVFMARFLGLQGFGVYSIAWMGVLIASSIHQPFIISAMQTISARKEGDEQKLYLQSLVFKQLIFSFLMGMLAFMAVLAMSHLMPQWNVDSILLAFPLAVFAFLLQDFFRRYYFMTSAPWKAFLIDAVAYGGVVLSAFAIHFIRDMDAQFVLLLTALFFLYASLIGLWSLDRLVFSMPHIKNIVKEHWDFSKWLTATAVLQWFSGNLFIMAAGALLGPVAVGATRMAQNLVGITHVLFLAMENIIPVRAVSHHKEGGNEQMFRYLWKFTLQMGTLTFTLLALLAVFSEPIIKTFYGESFLAYKYMLIGFCALYVIIFLGYPLRYAIRTLQNTRLIFISFIASSVFSVMAAYPLITRFGLSGVLAGLMITQCISLGIYLWSLRRELRKL